MITTARIRPDQWELLKRIRLTALQEAPYAFSATYAASVQRTDAEWQEMARSRASSPDDCSFFVYKDSVPVGMAGGYRETPQRVQLVAVWVAPAYRGSGAAEAVVEAVCEWAVSTASKSIAAWVTSGNYRAQRFYERLGFCDTGNRSPYPPDPTVEEMETVRQLSK